MSVLTKRTATCDACKEKQEFSVTQVPVPDGWVAVRLFRRIGGAGRQVLHLDLCPRCQEIVLNALGVSHD